MTRFAQQTGIVSPDQGKRAALRAARASNADDEHCYSHGCIAVEPGYEHLLPRIRSGVL